MIIIPTSRPIVLKSTASIACSWSSVPASTTSVAPSRAIFVRSTRSDAISASATTKTAMAKAIGCTSGVDDETPTRLPGTPPVRLARQSCSAACSCALGNAQTAWRRRSWRNTKRSWLGGRRPVRVIGAERRARLVQLQRAKAVAGEEALLARDLLRPLRARRRNNCGHPQRPLRSRLRHRTAAIKASGHGPCKGFPSAGSAKRRVLRAFPGNSPHFTRFPPPLRDAAPRSLRRFRACQRWGGWPPCRPLSPACPDMSARRSSRGSPRRPRRARLRPLARARGGGGRRARRPRARRRDDRRGPGGGARRHRGRLLPDPLDGGSRGEFVDVERRQAEAFAARRARPACAGSSTSAACCPHDGAPSRHLASRLAVEQALLDAVPESVALRASIVVARPLALVPLPRAADRAPAGARAARLARRTARSRSTGATCSSSWPPPRRCRQACRAGVGPRRPGHDELRRRCSTGSPPS